MNIEIRTLREQDLQEADRIFRLAFGTFIGLPDPMSFAGDADLVTTRWRADPAATIGAYLDDVLIGSNFVANWGSFGFFGPLTVRPDLWDKGIAQKLLAPTMDLFSQWGIRQAALFTFPHSTKHVGLYQKYGFWPQSLTAVMSKVPGSINAGRWSTYSKIPEDAREACLSSCAALTDEIFPGLDVRSEIQSVTKQNLGETVLIDDGSGVDGFAICHIGKGSEAGTGSAYIKFAAVRSGQRASQTFDRLLSACEALTNARGLEKLVAGVNTARHHAYRMLLERGFRTLTQGVAMQRPNDPGYNRPDCFVIDDWR
jgi:GNAT superfamily N-acetyltransferase